MGLRLGRAPTPPLTAGGPVSPQRMKASESTRLKAESSLRGELESRWQRLQEQAEERVQALQGQHEVGSPGPGAAGASGRAGGQGRGSEPPLPQQEECRLLEQCRGLDQAVIQLTKFVRQNQMSLNRILLAEQKAWWVSNPPFSPAPSALGQGLLVPPWRTLHSPVDTAPSRGPCDHSLSPAPRGLPRGSGASSQAPPGPALRGGSLGRGTAVLAPTPRDSKGHLEESRAGELAAFLQESLEAGQLAQQEAHSALELVRAAEGWSASPGDPRLPRQPC